MSPRYDEAPEAVSPSYPEVHHPHTGPEVASPYSDLHHTSTTPLSKPEHQNTFYAGGYAPSSPTTVTYGNDQGGAGSGGGYAFLPGTATGPAQDGKSGRGRQICGCPLVVFILSVIVAFLSAAVIGLAAGTGLAVNRASRAESQLASVSAQLANATAPPGPTDDYSKIDRGCSTNPGGVTGSAYTSDFFGKPSFKVYCNSDTPIAPLMGLFVGSFDDCIDACASWSYSLPGDFPKNSSSSSSASPSASASDSKNTTCAAVSFIPYWTNRDNAVKGYAPGNCYLKPGPQNRTALTTPNIGGQAVHAAILDK